jgi:hypothetical protein
LAFRIFNIQNALTVQPGLDANLKKDHPPLAGVPATNRSFADSAPPLGTNRFFRSSLSISQSEGTRTKFSSLPELLPGALNELDEAITLLTTPIKEEDLVQNYFRRAISILTQYIKSDGDLLEGKNDLTSFEQVARQTGENILDESKAAVAGQSNLQPQGVVALFQK